MSRPSGRRGAATTAILLALTTLGLAAATNASAAKQPRLKLESLSSSPDLVSGGEALVSVAVPKGVKPSKVRVRRNGRNVTAKLTSTGDDPRLLVGLIDGLRAGVNRISARAPGSSRAGELDLFNSSITGALFSGPQQSPFYCRTEDAGLGAPSDASCSAPVQVEYRYRSTGGGFKPLADPAIRPPDLAQTTTRDGRTVDYVVRVESGTINRSIYRWAILAPGGELGEGWNQRLIQSFGGGCGAGYQQGSSGIGTVLDDRQLSRGYSVISSSLTVLGTACNDVLSAETVSMVKEHVIETLGRPPVWTIGEGGSGGSIQAQLIAQNYPGLLDGLLPSASFPDAAAPDYPDCRLLNAYFATAVGAGLTDVQRRAITGMADPDGCLALGAGADVVNATEGCDESVVPASAIFDPVTNPGGARCTVWDSMVNVYGRDPATGYARRSLDNVGVQYGLAALQAGTITVPQFLDLNEAIGGYDNNGEIVAGRTVADPTALGLSHSTGRVNAGAGGFTEVPIVDARNYVDDEINVHQYVNTYKLRARLERLNGTAANHVMFRAQGNANVNAMNDAAIETIATWLDRIEADGSGAGLAEKVIANKPADAVDACWTNGGQRTNGAAVIGDPNLCETTYPPHSLPVQQAGKPLSSLALKCQLRATSPSDYPPMSAAQAARLAAIYPSGVCDWSKPGVEEQGLSGTWLSFGPSHQVKPRTRSLKLRASGGARLTLTATLRPCPETTWQRVVFERKRRREWRKIEAKLVTGGRCRAKLRLKLDHALEVRVSSKASDGYAGAHSKRIKLAP